MIRVPLTAEMREAALNYERLVLATGLEARPTYTGLAVRGRYALGHLGELAFLHLLRERRLRFRYQPQAEGRSDAFDFLLYRSGNALSVDTKTAAHHTHRYLMVPAAQFAAHQRDVYVGARRGEDSMEVFGWASRGDLAAQPIASPEHANVRIPTRMILLDELRSLDALFSGLDSL